VSLNKEGGKKKEEKENRVDLFLDTVRAITSFEQIRNAKPIFTTYS
jgi:hypothetical protein